jgi:hypothetical protein
MATVNKNFRIKNGLIVEGTTGTIDGFNILTESQASQDFIVNTIGGTATSENTPNTVVKRDGNGNFAAGQITIGDVEVGTAGYLYDDGALYLESNAGKNLVVNSGQNIDITSNGYIEFNTPDWAYINEDRIITQNATQTASNKTFDNVKLTGTISFKDNSDTSYLEISRSGNGTAKLVAADDLSLRATNDIVLYPGNDVNGHTGKAYIHWGDDNWNAYPEREIATHEYVDGEISAEVTNRNDAIDSAISTEVTNRNSAIATAKSEAISDANTYTDGKVSDLVDSAPALLDTLNELAAAIADNPNYATDVANLVATKADTTYVDSEISDLDSTAQGYATTAENNAKGYADTVSGTAYTNAVADAGTNAQNYTDQAISDGNSNAEPIYKGVKLGYYTELISGWNATSNGSTFSPLSWPSNYGTAKLTVHVRDGVHSQASEVLIARDSSNNIAITEYAIVSTNGMIADISASYLNGEIYLNVIPVNSHTTVESVATGSAIVWAD